MSAQPPYQTLAINPFFQEVVKDMASRSGIPDDQMLILFTKDNGPRMEVFEEFAKTFIPRDLDEFNNYEMYEMVGDMSINKSVVSYLFRVLHPLLSAKGHPESVSYLNNIKAHHVSTRSLSDMFIKIGFEDLFITYVVNDKARFDEFIRSKNANKDINNIYEDIMEAFCGCMETMIDRYIGMFKGFLYVNNFIVDILENKGINYDSSLYWTSAQVLKETNDKIRAAQRIPRPQGKAPLYTFDYKVDFPTNAYCIHAVPPKGTLDGRGQELRPFLYRNIKAGQYIQGQQKPDGPTQNLLATQLLEILSQDFDYKPFIRQIPSNSDLGIQSLIQQA